MKNLLSAGFICAVAIGSPAASLLAAPSDETATAQSETTQKAARSELPEGGKKNAQAKQVVRPIREQLQEAVRRLKPKFGDRRIMAAAVPHADNRPEHWPAAPAVLNQLLAALEAEQFQVPARVDRLVLGEKAVPPKSLIEDLQTQFEFDVLMTADYRRTDDAITIGLRVFDAKTRKPLHAEKFDLGNNVDALGCIPNRKVWEYCHTMKGYMVGNGECWTLAASALASTSSAHPYAFQYGRPISMTDVLVPGDLIQIEGVSIQGPGGMAISMGHHTAIVHRNLGGGVIELIHQNGPPLGRYVGLLPVNIYTQTSGSMFPYRPIPIVTQTSAVASETPETETTAEQPSMSEMMTSSEAGADMTGAD